MDLKDQPTKMTECWVYNTGQVSLFPNIVKPYKQHGHFFQENCDTILSSYRRKCYKWHIILEKARSMGQLLLCFKYFIIKIWFYKYI